MKIGNWTRWLLAALPLCVAGCGNFWQNPNTGGAGSFSLTNSGNLSIAPGATSGNTATITVTPGSSFTGTVTLTCAVTAPSAAVSPATCTLSPNSVSITDTNSQTATLTAATTSTTTPGAYQIAVTGVSGSSTETTSVCADVSTSSATCTAATGSSGNFYVLNQTTDQVAAFNISSGTLNSIGAVAVPVVAPLALTVAPNGQFLYVSTENGVYLYTIDSNTGALTLGNSGGLTISQEPFTTMQVDATNSWLIGAISGSNQLFALAIDPDTGQLATAGETQITANLPASTATQLAISPNDSSSCNSCYVFVGMGTGGTEIIGFNPGNATTPFGNTGHFNVLHSGGGDNAVAVDPNNQFLYVGESNSVTSGSQTGGVRVFSIGTGGISELSGSPYSTGGIGPSSILPSSDGNYVFVANRSVSGSSSGNISSYSVATTGLTFIATAAAGPTGVLGLAEDSTGGYLLATDFAGNPDLEAYTMSSGTLTSVLSVATGNDPTGALAIAAAP